MYMLFYFGMITNWKVIVLNNTMFWYIEVCDYIKYFDEKSRLDLDEISALQLNLKYPLLSCFPYKE